MVQEKRARDKETGARRSVNDLVQKTLKVPGAGFHAVAHGPHFLLDGMEAIGEVKTGQDCEARGVNVGRALGNPGDELIDMVCEFQHLAVIAGCDERKSLVGDGNPDRPFFLGSGLHGTPLAGAEQIHLPEEFFNACADLLALGMERVQFPGKPGVFAPGFGKFGFDLLLAFAGGVQFAL